MAHVSRKSSLIVWAHCSQSITKKTYGTHKRLYYDDDHNLWIKKKCLASEAEKEERFLTKQAFDECDFDFNTNQQQDMQDSSYETNRNHHIDSPPPLASFSSGTDDGNVSTLESGYEGKQHDFACIKYIYV